MHDPTFYPGWLRATHLVNLIFISFLMRSGIQILAAFPRLYWNDNTRPRDEWLKLTLRTVPDQDPDAIYDALQHPEHALFRPLAPRRYGPISLAVWGWRWLVYALRRGWGERAVPRRIHTSLDEELDISPWLGLPGHKSLGLGRHWHFVSDIIWIANGLVFVVLVVVSGYWPYYVPTSWSIVPEAAQSAWTYLHLQIAPALPGQPFNALQKLAYFFIVFLLAPFQIATGAAMSPSLAARFPWYIKLFGGRQGARSLHFLSLLVFIGFTVVHTIMIIVHGFGKEVAKIIWGQPEYRIVSIFLAMFAFACLVLMHVLATKWSLHHPRSVQRVLGAVISPPVDFFFGWEGSREEYARTAISPYFWVNGHPPVDDAYLAMVGNDFADWRLEVSGLVARPLCLSLADLRAMPKETQITKHNCIQGWSDVGEWGGVAVRHIMALCQPLPQARYVVFHAMDNKATSEKDAPAGGYFYGTLNLRLAQHEQTILAYEFSGAPLPIPHGAPLRLRVETQLGFKMVKWLHKIEFIADYKQVGRGMGGWREDYDYYDTEAGI